MSYCVQVLTRIKGGKKHSAGLLQFGVILGGLLPGGAPLARAYGLALTCPRSVYLFLIFNALSSTKRMKNETL